MIGRLLARRVRKQKLLALFSMSRIEKYGIVIHKALFDGGVIDDFTQYIRSIPYH